MSHIVIGLATAVYRWQFACRMARTGSQPGPAVEPDDFERDDGNRMIIKVVLSSLSRQQLAPCACSAVVTDAEVSWPMLPSA